MLVEREQHNIKKAQQIKQKPPSWGLLLCEEDMRFIILSDSFYAEHTNCTEMLLKQSRPYACIAIKVHGTIYAIPIRHNIKHKYCYHTIDDCGLDYTKTVVIRSDADIGAENVIIESKEFQILKKNERRIAKGLSDYIALYKKAKEHSDNENYRNILKYSTLKYFEEYIE